MIRYDFKQKRYPRKELFLYKKATLCNFYSGRYKVQTLSLNRFTIKINFFLFICTFSDKAFSKAFLHFKDKSLKILKVSFDEFLVAITLPLYLSF